MRRIVEGKAPNGKKRLGIRAHGMNDVRWIVNDPADPGFMPRLGILPPFPLRQDKVKLFRRMPMVWIGRMRRHDRHSDLDCTALDKATRADNEGIGVILGQIR